VAICHERGACIGRIEPQATATPFAREPELHSLRAGLARGHDHWRSRTGNTVEDSLRRHDQGGKDPCRGDRLQVAVAAAQPQRESGARPSFEAATIKLSTTGPLEGKHRHTSQVPAGIPSPG
jgi:hypothetical protein